MNLNDEYQVYSQDRARAFLEKKNFPADVIHKAASAPLSLVGGFNGCGIWEPDEAGKDALLFPVDYQGEIINIVAWEPYKPTRWYLRFPDDTFLGLNDLYQARIFSKTIKVFDTPADWLMGNKKGCCPLTNDSLLELMGLTIDCSDQMFARIKKTIEEAYPVPTRSKK